MVTEAWVYQSVSQESWADVRAFLHPRYAQRPHRVDVFKGKKVCVLDSVNPPREVLADLVQAAGGRVTRDITEAGVALIVFGKNHLYAIYTHLADNTTSTVLYSTGLCR